MNRNSGPHTVLPSYQHLLTGDDDNDDDDDGDDDDDDDDDDDETRFDKILGYCLESSLIVLHRTQMINTKC